MTIPSVIADSYKVPGSFIQVAFGVGGRSAGSAPIKILVTGNKTSAGTATVEESVRVYSPDEAKTLFGPGSELHLMCEKVFRTNPTAHLTAIPIAESAGTAATRTIVSSGTATAAGAVTVWVSNLGKVVAPIAVGDDATAVGDAIAAAINARTDWPVTAANVTGTVTVTAKHKGPRGNFIAIRSIQEVGTGITHTPPAGAYLTSGATMDDPANALDFVAPERFHFIVSPYDSTTELALYKAHCDDEAVPVIGRRQVWFAGSIDTLANTITVSDAVNAARGRLVWHYNGLDTPAEIAAAYAGLVAGEIGSDRATNFDDVTISGLAPQLADADKPLDTELDSALNSGITPLYSAGVDVAICRAVTNYHLDSATNPDFTVLDMHKVDVTDFVADDIQVQFRSEFPNAKLRDDDPDEDPPPGVVTPSMLRDWLYGLLKDHETDGELENVTALLPQLAVEIDEDVDGRINATIPVDPVKLLHQGSMDVRQVG